MKPTATIEERLARLERENRRLKLAGAALLMGFVGIIAGGPGSIRSPIKLKPEAS